MARKEGEGSIDGSTRSSRASQKGASDLLKRKSGKDLDVFRQELNIDDHIITLGSLVRRYGTDLEDGLEPEAAAYLLRKNGPNCLMPPKTKSRAAIFMEYMFGGFAILLWMGIILSLTGYTVAYLSDPETPYDQLYLATVLFLVITITGFFGFYQESANTSIMEGFRKMIPKTATVIRGGEVLVVPSEDLVVGDIVKIESGGCVPADIRIIECSGLKVDNSSITGESDPQLRSAENTDLNPLETANLAFYGTNVVEGSGKGMVIMTGDHTLMGHIACLTSGLQPEVTPIKRELTKFIHVITTIAVTIGAIFLVVSIIMDGDVFKAGLYFIAIVVAQVPEGLLVTMTACLTLTARKMSKKNCLVKNLHAIETLGSTNVICSDKTGTLTQNRMTVSHMCYDGTIVDVLSETYSKANSNSFKLLGRVGILCSRAEFDKDQEDVPIMLRIVKGDASETAVLKCMEINFGNTEEFRNQHTKIFEIPFNSTNKYQLSIHAVPGSTQLILVMKGAPERIMERCSTIYITDKPEELDDAYKRKLKMALLELGYMGERVLGFADLELPAKFKQGFAFDGDNVNFPVDGLRFLGFMSMIDPPRPGVPEAVSKCKTAGIKVIMVTGDHPITAMSIAKKVGIISAENETVYDIAMRRNVSVSKVMEDEVVHCKATVVTGSDLREMENEDLDLIIARYGEIVFARTSPQQKLQIVEAFQRSGHIVAVTGDGVNDSPALKKSDIGIAMGISGSDVSKDAADMIILDDNFASIVVGIEEGRLIFDNLKKSIAYMMTSNIPEVIPFLLHVLLGIPQALTIMAILLIDVGTDLWPGISLAYELAESDIMRRPPRDQKTERLVSVKLICFTNINIGLTQACAGFACYFYAMSEHGFLPARLMYSITEWESEKNDMKDSYGQEWTKEERRRLERTCVSTFFLAIVMTQVADCIICKTRRLSVFQHGMSNTIMNVGIAFECTVALVAVYAPYVNKMLSFEPIYIYLVLPAVPFAFFIFIFDEIRKYLIRKHPQGWVERETYF